jgi:hypothetical protein
MKRRSTDSPIADCVTEIMLPPTVIVPVRVLDPKFG